MDNFEYSDKIVDLLSLFEKMIKECDYSNLNDISHKRIKFMNSMINKGITNGYNEYHILSWLDYEELQTIREQLEKIYMLKIGYNR